MQRLERIIAHKYHTGILFAYTLFLTLLTGCIPAMLPLGYDAEIPVPTPRADESIQVHRIATGGVANAFLIASTEGMILVDAGPPLMEQQILDKMVELGRNDLRLIFITHAHIDHYGGASIIRAVTGAPIAIHRADADALAKGETRLGSINYVPRWATDPLLPALEPYARIRPTEADILLDDGDRLDAYGLDGYLLHLPGHTPGSAGIVIEDRLAFVGDLLSTTGTPHIQRMYAHDWPQVLESVDRLAEIAPKLIYAGHGSQPLTPEELHALRE